MPPRLALFFCLVFVLWLLVQDRKRAQGVSVAIWIPLVWLAILSSRPISLWFDLGLHVETPEDYLEGSPLDRNVFLLQIVLGIGVLMHRGLDPNRILQANRMLVAFLLYCGVSAVWSDYPFVAFKRWIKDLGNFVMIMVILTEKDPIQATRLVLARATYFLIPFSVLFIKYFPEFGRYYSRWTWQPVYCGVTTEKNALGSVAFISGIFLVWDWIQSRRVDAPRLGRWDSWIRLLLLLMVVYLIDKADSSAALMSLVIGAGTLIFLHRPKAMRRVKHLGLYVMLTLFGFLAVYLIPGAMEGALGMLGENITLTGRTDIWAALLEEKINPLVGTGYQSFWLGPWVEEYWKRWYFHPNQAHNGYLETYLNGGLLGLGLLVAMIISSGARMKLDLLRGSRVAPLHFSFFLVMVLYNWTEAMFNKLSPVWFVMLLAIADYPRRAKPPPQSSSPSPAANEDQHAVEPQPEIPVS